MPRGGVDWGAVIEGGFRGYGQAQAFDLAQQRAKREQDVADRDKKREAAFKELADLAEKYAGAYPIVRARIKRREVPAVGGLSPEPVQPLTPVARNPAAGNVAQNPAMPPSPGMPPAAPGMAPSPGMARSPAMPPARMPTSIAAVATHGVNVAGVGNRSAAPGVPAPGPKTDEDRMGYSLWREPAMLSNPHFLNEAAKIFLKHGMPEGVAWLERGARAQRENAIEAAKRLAAGDVPGFESAFNSAGRTKIVPGSTKDLGGGKYRVTYDGGETHDIDARQFLRGMLNPADYLRVDQSEKRTAETERHNRATEDIQREAARSRGAEKPTALQKNIRFLIDAGVAKDAASAHAMLRTGMAKPEQDAILGLAENLMRSPRYMGKDGNTRAIADATLMVRSIRSDTAAGEHASTFGSAEDVRAAYRAGRIDRARAIKELGAYGFSPE